MRARVVVQLFYNSLSPLSLGFWFRSLFSQVAEVNRKPFEGVPASML